MSAESTTGPQSAWATTTGRRTLGAFGAALLTLASVALAVWPLTSVISAGRWSNQATTVALLIAATGLLVRRLAAGRRGRILLPLLAQIVMLVGSLTLLNFRDDAWLGVLPSPAVVSRALGVLTAAGLEVRNGAAPLESTPALAFSLALAVGILLIALDLLIIVARVPLLAGLCVAVVGALPSIIVPGDVNLFWFVLLSILILALLRLRIDERLAAGATPAVSDAPAPRPRARVTAMVGAATIVGTLLVAPALPVSATGLSFGGTMSLNPSLRLGEDLRRPAPAPALTLVTDATRAPYLRVATLSSFDGEVWHPDQTDSVALRTGFGAPQWSEEVATTTQRSSVRVTGISSTWLPVPYPATDIRGLDGVWRIMPSNRTVMTHGADAAGQTYTVDALDVSPTLEQVRAANAALPAPTTPEQEAANALLHALPEDLPPIVAQLAAEVTGNADNDYDRLAALQTWFRAGFRYSLETPVEEDFDGTGVEAVARFLEERSGYCIHFAGAFALMARALDMPTRIVVGYLPGRESEEKQDGKPIYVVSSDQLHSWPEVYFDGIGWVPFEPTATLGVPTRFSPAATSGNTASPDTPTATTAPSAAPGADSDVDRRDADAAGGAAAPLRTLNPLPVLLTVLGVLIAGVVPGLVRLVRRRVRIARAHRGDPEAAWAEVHDTLVDLGLPASAADTPRARGAALHAGRAVDAASIDELVRAVERTRFARHGYPPHEGPDLARALHTVRHDLLRSVSGRERMLAMVAPRSLLGRRAMAPALA
ncbi:transglutaminase-like putative cysteine protease [Microbacterium keratanolyticum]|uniref:Transglutaminase n=1 Tax=Microbacterium keratanolyticum TaxID=67574 RepID=A0A9W6M8L2_9MICO|nr:DUF3488 and transglutaminase-like domain-containing protein [Microbacterium keratanolyticum]MBM7469593.1 transglutaminase-like putative cysteine protease [Microbacterium keratanolyticum]GLK01672.1 transglutaminase [Microbacterium keratanolyticum]